MHWKPADIETVKQIVESNPASCDGEQIRALRKYATEPYFAAINRYGKMERVIVIARCEDEVIYWEDIEEGFNISSVDTAGQILKHGCNQDTLGLARNAWMKGRTKLPRVGPAKAC